MSVTYNIPANINASGGELQNVKLQSLASTPADASEGRFWYDSANHRPMFHNGTSASVFGNSYTFSTGLTNTNGTITVTNYNKLLQNLATGTGSLAIGDSADDDNKANVVAIGKSASGSHTYNTAIGAYADAHGEKSIQIGYGTNSTDKSLSIGFYDSTTPVNYQLLDGTTGLIPDARLSSNIARTSALSDYIPTSQKGANSGVAELDSNGKVPSSQLPGYVDDVIETYIVSGATALSSGWLSLTSGGSALTPETGKLYVVVQSGDYQNREFRWGGTTYAEINKAPGDASESTAGIAKIASSTDMSYMSNDTKIVTPLKLKSYVEDYVAGIKAIVSDNPALTVSSGVVTWEISYVSITKLNIANVRVFDKSSGETIFAPWKSGSGKVTIEMLASANVSAGTYRAIVLKVSGID